MSTKKSIFQRFASFAALAPSIVGSTCPAISTTYGSVEVVSIPTTDHFAVHGPIVCVNDRNESLPIPSPIFHECPDSSNVSEAFVEVQSAINVACLRRHDVKTAIREWLEMDLFESAHVVSGDFNITVECSKTGAINGYLDHTIKGDLRTAQNRTDIYVQVSPEKWEFPSNKEDHSPIIAVLEPVWQFMSRAVGAPSGNLRTNNKLQLTIGEKTREIQSITERHKKMTFSVYAATAETAQSNFLAVRMEIPESLPTLNQSWDCLECVTRSYPKGEKCVGESVPLTNTCGMIIGSCSEMWWEIKKVCEMCVIPF